MWTTDQVLDEMLRGLPPRYAAAREVLAVYAAPLAHVMNVLESDFSPSVTVAAAKGVWLTLLAKGYGIYRADAEQDAALRARLRNFEDAQTVASIEAAVDALLALYAGGTCELVEHWAVAGACDDEDRPCICDVSYLYDAHNAFTLIVPLVAGDAAHPVYPAIVAEVERLRAAGVRWWLALAE